MEEMFEQTNQTETQESEMFESTENHGDSGEDLFSDYEEETAENTETGDNAAGNEEGQEMSNEEGENQSQGSEEGKKEEKPSEDAKMITVKFNGENIEVPIDQAQILIQKGMNYDHVKTEVDEFRGTLEFYASQNGLTVPQYIKALKEQQETAAIQTEIETLSKKLPDENPEVIKMLAELIYKDKQHEAEKASEKQKREAQEEEDKVFREFVKKFPEVKEIPPEVAQKVKDGENLITAYQEYENQKLRDQIAHMETTKKTEQKNQENKNTALGSLDGENTNTERDPFLEGLNSI